MGLGAIVIVPAGHESFTAGQASERKALLSEPLACVDVIGRSMLERTVEHLVRAEVDVVTVVASTTLPVAIPVFPWSSVKVQVQCAGDIAQTVNEYRQSGIEHALVTSADLYAETDLLDFFYFHREARQTITRALDHEGNLNLWAVDCLRSRQSDLESLLRQDKGNGAPYFAGGYVRRLTSPQDLRYLSSDVLRGRCTIRPNCREVKPGIWIEDGAEVDRRARIVAPAYIGRGSQVEEDALITRCSSIEENCCIEYGTVVEDSSILANTHVGLWLDVCHAVANGNKLLSLEHDVVLEISDANVLRSTCAVRANHNLNLHQQHEGREQEIVTDLRAEKSPAAEAWQLGTNPIQG